MTEPGVLSNYDVLHENLTALAKHHLQATTHTLQGDISSHTIGPATVSFKQLSAFLDAVKSLDRTYIDKIFVGTSHMKVRVSVAPKCKLLADDLPPMKKGTKRGRQEPADELAEKVKHIVQPQIEQLRTSATETGLLDSSVYEAASLTMQRLLYNLKGPAGQQLIESWALSALTGNGPQVPQWATGPKGIILMLRFAPGLPVPLALLRRIMAASFYDGILTITRDVRSDSDTLPLTDEGVVSERAGQVSMRMFAQIGIVSGLGPSHPPQPTAKQ